MFRDLLAKGKAITIEECISLLITEKRGVLSVIGDDGYPYGMPMNHFYNESENTIYFHCGKSGHRIDALSKCSKASFCVYDSGKAIPGDWALRVKSVIVFGRIEIIDDMQMITDIMAKLSRKFTHDEEYIKREIEQYGYETILLKLTPEHISGKQITES